MAKGSSVYSVEGVVWAGLTVAWLFLRLSFGRAPLEEAALIPSAALAVAGLVSASLSESRESTERFYFQMVFSLWLAFLYQLVECLVTPPLHSRFLEAPGLGSVLPTVSAGVSLALLTVQILVAAAAVSDSLWAGLWWTDASFALVACFHACLRHGDVRSTAFAFVVLGASGAVMAILAARALASVPPSSGLGLLSTHQILEITSISLKTVAAAFALAGAYLAGHTTWALPAVLGGIVAVDLLHLLFKSKYRELPSAPDEMLFESPPPPQQPPPKQSQTPPQPQQQQQQQPQQQQQQQQQPQPPPRQPANFFQVYKPHVYHPQAKPRQRPPPFNPAVLHAPEQQPMQALTSLITSSKLAQDSLLFGNTKPLVAKNKKNS